MDIPGLADSSLAFISPHGHLGLLADPPHLLVVHFFFPDFCLRSLQHDPVFPDQVGAVGEALSWIWQGLGEWN